MDEYKLKSTFEKINNHLGSYVIKDKIIQLDKIYDKISSEVENNINIEKERLLKVGSLLHNLSPLATIDRGYSIVQKNGELINSIENLNLNESIDITLKDGNLECIIEKINNKEV